MIRRSRCLVACLAMVLASVPAAAGDEPRAFAGALFGVAALSTDARSVTTGSEAAISIYAPGNGPALNVFGGIHLAHYFTLQVNWIWNRNDLTLTSSFTSPDGGGFFEQQRESRQHAVVFDGLVYFRRLDSAIRPYLGTGLSIAHFSSARIVSTSARNLSPPAGEISSIRVGLRSHVGIDVRITRHVDFRYSFSETISGNPISPSLRPPGERALMNFQNLFGFVSRF